MQLNVGSLLVYQIPGGAMEVANGGMELCFVSQVNTFHILPKSNRITKS
jgi:hypothetical protein